MIRILYHSPEGEIRTDAAVESLGELLKVDQGVLWVDVMDEKVDTSEALLRDQFHFHPLAIDDALHETHVPKIDDWDNYLYLVLHSAAFISLTDQSLHTLELDIFLGDNYLVTYHEKPIEPVERVWKNFQRDERRLQKGAGYLLYQIIDELVTDYMPLVEQLDDAIERFEDRVFDQPSSDMLQNLFTLKRALLQLRRIVMPEREVLNKLSRGDYHVIVPEHRIYFRDVYDHLVRLYDINESMRDLVTAALETYLSVINNRMNDVMKTLTLITTVLMPISFIASFFGMNFFQAAIPRDPWTSQPIFWLTLVAMFVLPISLYIWISRRTQL